MMGRAKEVKSFGGADKPSPFGSNSTATGVVTTLYNADAVTTTDAAGVWRATSADARGRTVAVTEGALGYLTSYSYDALGGLATVCQNPNGTSCGRSRTFVYSSLDRLLTATNPESGTIAYEYDANGNLRTRTEPGATVVSTGYDHLNRPVTKTYTGTTTSAVTYCYDGDTNEHNPRTNRRAPAWARQAEPAGISRAG